jgi:hypothetical protein
MRIKLDENLPLRLVDALTLLGHDVHSVREEALSGSSDAVLWEVVRREGRFLITQDLDFSDMRQFAPGTHAGLLLVRLRRPGRDLLYRFVYELFRRHDVTAWQGAFMVATEHKVRFLYKPQKDTQA